MNNQDEQPSFLRWEAGMEFASEKEYQAAAAWLAKEFLRDHTPTQLALMAAQYVIYTDTLQGTNSALKDCIASLQRTNNMLQSHVDTAMEQDQLEQLKKEVMAKNIANICRTVLDAHRTYIARKAASVRHQNKNEQKAAALAEWDATGSEYESRADFTRIISSRDGIKYMTLYEWIGKHEKAKTKA